MGKEETYRRDRITMSMIDLQGREENEERVKQNESWNLLESNNPVVLIGKIWLWLGSGKPRITARARNNWSQLYSCDWTVTNYT